MNSILKKNQYVPIIFIDRYNSFINQMIEDGISYESLFYILSIYEDMSLKYKDKYDLIDKKTVITRILNNKDTLITKYNVKTIWLFGSYVRDESTEYSDVDLYVDFSADKTKEEFEEFKSFMEQILKRRTDIHIEGKVYERFAPNGKESREVVFDVNESSC